MKIIINLYSFFVGDGLQQHIVYLVLGCFNSKQSKKFHLSAANMAFLSIATK